MPSIPRLVRACSQTARLAALAALSSDLGRMLAARFERGLESLDGRRGGDLAGGMAAHAVGHGVQAGRHEELVLVVRADKAYVGGRTDEELAHLCSSSTLRPTCTRSPRRRGTAPSTLRPFTRVPLVEPRSSTQ